MVENRFEKPHGESDGITPVVLVLVRTTEIRSTAHLCSGHMLVIEHAPATYAAVYGVSNANHPPHRAIAATELASAGTHISHGFDGE